MSPTWTILIPTLGQRHAELKRLLDVLLPQLESYGDRVRVVAMWNNGEFPLATIRQTLMMSVSTTHVCFIDDDDLVPEYYARDIMRALEYDPDFVGWQVECVYDGHESQMGYHSLRYGSWYNEGEKLYRDITHTDVMRTKIAQTADFRRVRRYRAEDRVWANQLRESGLLRREVYIDRVMYHYLISSTTGETWRHPRRIERRHKHVRLSVDHPNFEWYEGKMLSDLPANRTRA